MRAGTDWRRLLALDLSVFGFFGLIWGCFAVLLTDLSGSSDLSPGPLGIALFVGAGASIVWMAALGWSSDRLVYLALLMPLVAAFTVAHFPQPGAEETGEERPPDGAPPAPVSEAKGGIGRWDLYRSRSLLPVTAIACLDLLA